MRCVFQWFINTSQLKISPTFNLCSCRHNFQITIYYCGGLRRHKSSSTFQRSWTIGCVCTSFFIETHFLWHLYFLISEGRWLWNRKNVRMWFTKLSLELISWWYFWQSNRRRFRSFQISKNFLGFRFFDLFSLFFWLL